MSRTQSIIRISESEFREHCDEDDGFCLVCNSVIYGGVEPDARGYLCENCGKRGVFGFEELLMMGRVEFTEEVE